MFTKTVKGHLTFCQRKSFVFFIYCALFFSNINNNCNTIGFYSSMQCCFINSLFLMITMYFAISTTISMLYGRTLYSCIFCEVHIRSTKITYFMSSIYVILCHTSCIFSDKWQKFSISAAAAYSPSFSCSSHGNGPAFTVIYCDTAATSSTFILTLDTEDLDEGLVLKTEHQSYFCTQYSAIINDIAKPLTKAGCNICCL